MSDPDFSTAKITRVFRGREDHDIETVFIYLAGSGWSQWFGGLAFDGPAQSADFLRSVCQVFGVADSERLVGAECLALRYFPDKRMGPIDALRSVATGRTFSIAAWRRTRHPDIAFKNPAAARIEEIDRKVASLQDHISWLHAERQQVGAGFVAIDGEEAP